MCSISTSYTAPSGGWPVQKLPPLSLLEKKKKRKPSLTFSLFHGNSRHCIPEVHVGCSLNKSSVLERWTLTLNLHRLSSVSCHLPLSLCFVGPSMSHTHTHTYTCLSLCFVCVLYRHTCQTLGEQDRVHTPSSSSTETSLFTGPLGSSGTHGLYTHTHTQCIEHIHPYVQTCKHVALLKPIRSHVELWNSKWLASSCMSHLNILEPFHFARAKEPLGGQH